MQLGTWVLSQECKAIVAEYGETIIKMLLAKDQPEKICLQIGLWTFNGAQALSMGIESAVDESAGKSGKGLHDTYCTFCEMVVLWV